jgi:1-acyl-sn-glycerol-3-phosphate acyltransferase
LIVPPLPPAAPRFGNAATRGIGLALLRLFRWKVIGRVPNLPKLVAVAAPHTSALDVFVGVAVMLAIGARVRWLAKHTTFRWPLGPPLRWLGGIPVDRAHPATVVRDVIELMVREEQMYLALAPEGTRRKVSHWKSGFYRIASAAGVPILPVALDYSRRVADLGPLLTPGGDYEADVQVLKRHFAAPMARHPDHY